MADISSLSGLAPVEQLDLDSSYAVNKPKPKFQLPKRGVYTLQAPAQFTSESFGVSKAGALTVAIDPTILDESAAGYQLRYTKVSAKVYQRDGQNVSQLGDYLNACGVTGSFNSPQDLADAAEATAGLTFRAELDWRAYKDGFEVEGMTKFPKLEDGTHQSWVDHPTAKEERDGKQVPVRCFANLFIRNFLPAV